MIVRRSANTSGTQQVQSPNNFVRQLADFVNACRTGAPPRVSARQGAESLRLIDALYAARKPLPEFSVGPFPQQSSPQGVSQ
jgi:predicted dehydrogenase